MMLMALYYQLQTSVLQPLFGTPDPDPNLTPREFQSFCFVGDPSTSHFQIPLKGLELLISRALVILMAVP